MKPDTEALFRQIVERCVKGEIFEDKVSIGTPDLFVVDGVWGEWNPYDLVVRIKDRPIFLMEKCLIGRIGKKVEEVDFELINLLRSIIDRHMRYNVVIYDKFTVVSGYLDFLVQITAERWADMDELLKRFKPAMIEDMMTKMMSIELRPLSERVIGYKMEKPFIVPAHIKIRKKVLSYAIQNQRTLEALEVCD